MCRNQLGRRNLTDEQKTVLIGQAYKAQKLTNGGDRKSSAQSEHLKNARTSEIVAKDFGVGKETVKRAEHFVDGLEAAEKVSPGIKEAVLSGEINKKIPATVAGGIDKRLDSGYTKHRKGRCR